MDLLRDAENILKEKNLEVTEENLKIVVNNLKKGLTEDIMLYVLELTEHWKTWRKQMRKC